MSDRRAALFASIPLVLLVVILMLLAGNLGDVVFSPGALPAASYETSNEEITISGGYPTLSRFINILKLIVPLAAVLALYATYTAIRNRSFRVLRSATIAMIVMLSLYLLSPLLQPPDREEENTGQATTSSAVTVVSEENHASQAMADEPADSSLESNWHILLTVGVIVVLACGLAAYSVLQRRNNRRRTLLELQGEPLDELVGVAADAADRLRAGHDVRGVVRECYAQMVRILEPEVGSSICLTPREFSAALADAGMQSCHITQLTHLFELVRYGERPDDRFADQALRCLDGIQQAHATTGGAA